MNDGLILVEGHLAEPRGQQQLTERRSCEGQIMRQVAVTDAAEERGFGVGRVDDQPAPGLEHPPDLFDQREHLLAPEVLDEIEGDDDIPGAVRQDGDSLHQIALGDAFDTQRPRRRYLLPGPVDPVDVSITRLIREVQHRAVAAPQVKHGERPVLGKMPTDQAAQVRCAGEQQGRGRRADRYQSRGHVVTVNPVTITLLTRGHCPVGARHRMRH